MTDDGGGTGAGAGPAGAPAGAFGALLRDHRRDAGLTQEALAARAGLSRRGLQRLEAGGARPHPARLDALVEALALGPDARARLRAALAARPRASRLAPERDGSGAERAARAARSADDLPAGTVAFLFTDLEGSTRLLQAHPHAYREAVRRHRALLRGAVEAHGVWRSRRWATSSTPPSPAPGAAGRARPPAERPGARRAGGRRPPVSRCAALTRSRDAV
jgi:transcriptional regulator with XRE-family HTH domain